MMQQRSNRPIQMPTRPVPMPAEKQITVTVQELPRIDPTFNLSARLQPGHLHGKNVRSVGRPSLENDVTPGEPLAFEFEIPATLPSADQWAFRGTFLDTAVRIAEMRYLTLSIPADMPPRLFNVELKRDDTPLAVTLINTTQPGTLSADGQWKTITVEIRPAMPEATRLPMNYISIAVDDPGQRSAEFRANARSGVIRIKDITLSERHPSLRDVPADGRVAPAPGEMQLLEGWSPRGPLADVAIKDTARDVWRIPGGQGLWGWNYVAVRDLSRFKFINVKMRNTSGAPNQIFFEFKNESEGLLGTPINGITKVRLTLPADDQWRVVQIPIPAGITKPMNVIAVSDPRGDLELSSIALSNAALAPGAAVEPARAPAAARVEPPAAQPAPTPVEQRTTPEPQLPPMPGQDAAKPIPLPEFQRLYPPIQELIKTNRTEALRQLGDLLRRVQAGVTEIPTGQEAQWQQFFKQVQAI